jgi:hypothetical protein
MLSITTKQGFKKPGFYRKKPASQIKYKIQVLFIGFSGQTGFLKQAL